MIIKITAKINANTLHINQYNKKNTNDYKNNS